MHIVAAPRQLSRQYLTLSCNPLGVCWRICGAEKANAHARLPTRIVRVARRARLAQPGHRRAQLVERVLLLLNRSVLAADLLDQRINDHLQTRHLLLLVC